MLDKHAREIITRGLWSILIGKPNKFDLCRTGLNYRVIEKENDRERKKDIKKRTKCRKNGKKKCSILKKK